MSRKVYKIFSTHFEICNYIEINRNEENKKIPMFTKGATNFSVNLKILGKVYTQTYNFGN